MAILKNWEASGLEGNQLRLKWVFKSLKKMEQGLPFADDGDDNEKRAL